MYHKRAHAIQYIHKPTILGGGPASRPAVAVRCQREPTVQAGNCYGFAED